MLGLYMDTSDMDKLLAMVTCKMTRTIPLYHIVEVDQAATSRACNLMLIGELA